MKADKLKTGRRGEDIAKRYLQDKGYVVLEQNYRSRYAEIDLIVRKMGILVFVEVRTKTDERFGSPEETIDRGKIKKLLKNAHAYAANIKYFGIYRIDAICVVLNSTGGIRRIDHYENINC